MNPRQHFAKASRHPDTRSGEAISMIVNQRPDLAEAEFYLPSLTNGGCNSQTFIVNDEVIKVNDDIYVGVELEAKVQAYFHGKGCLVPQVLSIAPNNLFFSMAYQDGVQFSSRVNHLQKEQRHAIAEQMGVFKAQLYTHSLTDEFRHFTVFYDERAEMQSSTRIENIHKQLRVPQVEKVFNEAPLARESLKNFMGDLGSREAIALHNDLNGNLGNTLLNRETSEVVSFLDFGSLKTSRLPEEEFTHIRSRFNRIDPLFADVVMDSYVATLPQAHVFESVGAIVYNEMKHLGSGTIHKPQTIEAVAKIVQQAEGWLKKRGFGHG